VKSYKIFLFRKFF